jgi:hypothetical protein
MVLSQEPPRQEITIRGTSSNPGTGRLHAISRIGAFVGNDAQVSQGTEAPRVSW